MQLTGSISYTMWLIFVQRRFYLIVLYILIFPGFIRAQHSFPPPASVAYTGGNLPLMLIDTEGVELKDKSKDERIAVRLRIVEPGTNKRVSVSDTTYSYNGYAGLKYRGNSSFSSSAKKPYSLELWENWYPADTLASDKAVSLLGMPAASDWIILAPYNDKSFLRDVLMMELMKGTQMYLPRMRFFELIFNGRYYGLYVLSEKIERGKNRLDIASSKKSTPQESGFHLEVDRSDEAGFYSVKEIRNLLGVKENWRQKPWYQIKYPKSDAITPEQELFIRQRIDSFETVMESARFADSLSGYHRYLDEHSAKGFFIAQELSRNVDGYRLSTPLYKDADSKDRRFKLSLWDFNIAFGNADYGWAWSTEGWSYNQTAFAAPFWFKQLLRDPVFRSSLQQYWRELRSKQLSDERINSVLDSLMAVSAEAAQRNNQAWQLERKTVWPVYYLASSYADELDYLQRWLRRRIYWIDNQWSDLPRNFIYNGKFDEDTDIGIASVQKITLSQWPLLGGKPHSTVAANSGLHSYEIKERKIATQLVTELLPGLYTLRVKVKTFQSPDAYIFVKNHGRSEQKVNIPNTEGDFRTVELRNVDVTNPHCEIGIAAWYSTASSTARVWYDDVEFVRQGTISEVRGITDDIRITLLRDGMYIRGIATPVDYQLYSIAGQKISSGTFLPNEVVSLYNLKPGVYVILLVQDDRVTRQKIKID